MVVKIAEMLTFLTFFVKNFLIFNLNVKNENFYPELKAGGKLKIIGVAGLENVEFSVKSVSHNLNTTSYMIDVEFEG